MTPLHTRLEPVQTSLLPSTLSFFWNILISSLWNSCLANYNWDLTVFISNRIISGSWFVPIYIFVVISSNYIFIQNRVSPGYSCNVWVQASFICMLCKSLCAFLSFFWINKITKFELFSKEASSIKRKMKLKVNTRNSLFLFLLRSPCRLLGIIRIHEQVG